MTNDNLKMRGFTLIELLAVIVILAVIALIAVPRIIEILNKSRLSAAEDSTYGIVEAAESYISNFMLQNQGALPSENLIFKCSSEGCTLANELTNYNTENLTTLEFKGKKPTGGSITISKNGNKVTVYGLLINNFICNYGDGIADCIDVGDIGSTKENPPTETQYKGVKAIVYLDPTDFTHKCISTDVNSDTETKTGCMKWYAYAEDNTQNTYTMILDHNTTALVAWNSTNSNSEMKEAKTQLESDTKEWNKSLNPRLITVNEIVTIVGYNDWNSNGFYFQDFGNNTGTTQACAISSSCKYAWLYDRTNGNCKNSFGCLNNAVGSTVWGYWTSSPYFNNSSNVWFVNDHGAIGNQLANLEVSLGIRPVITISKSLIRN